MKNIPLAEGAHITVTPSERGFRLRCACGCLDVPHVPESEVGMLARIHFNASHLNYDDNGEKP